MRFGEMASIYESRGCSIIFYPGAFEMKTGEAHWELLTRSRALDNQVYVVANTIARNPQADWLAWSHSLVCNPYGEIVSRAGYQEEIIYADIGMPCYIKESKNKSSLITLTF